MIWKVINLIGDLRMKATVGLGYIGHTSVNKIGRKVRWDVRFTLDPAFLWQNHIASLI